MQLIYLSFFSVLIPYIKFYTYELVCKISPTEHLSFITYPRKYAKVIKTSKSYH